MNLELTYAEATANIEKVLAQGGFAKARVFIARHRGRRIVVKDFGSKGFWERNLIGRMVISREFRAYRALAGIDGLLAAAKRLPPFSLAVEYLDGIDLGGLTRGEIGRGVIEQFERIVNAIHSRGWVHLDLQRRSNILLVNGKVFVVDLASAFVPGAFITLFGEGLRLWAAGHLRKNKQLTATGPYSYVKNPLYIGTLLITVGASALAMKPWIMTRG